MDAFINEAKDNNDFSNLNLAAASYLNLSNGLTITSVEANKADDPTSPFTALLNYPGDNTASNVALGTDYSRNVWLAYPASKQSAIDALKGVMQEVTGGQTLEEKIKSYQVGSGVAQYSKEKHDKLVELWTRLMPTAPPRARIQKSKRWPKRSFPPTKISWLRPTPSFPVTTS